MWHLDLRKSGKNTDEKENGGNSEVTSGTDTKTIGEDDMTKNREYYRKLFQDYPELVGTNQLRKMLGGVGELQVRHLLQQKRIKSFQIRREYRIPKEYVIDYVLSDDYREYSRILLHTV